MFFPYPRTKLLLENAPRDKEAYEHLLNTFAEEYLGIPLSKETIALLTEEEAENEYTWYYALKHQTDYFEGHETLDSADIIFSTLQDLLVHAATKKQ